ncbi:URA6 [Candida pseudojiufengensis]|uniref:URA6 n=1 Tax=Candida pseudojiufengensis TaxID=497109 RepID=UPI0022253183|nr:URA6 [Candida pseudojiufengensis]KAI5966550.1 URA6 [Candida pseudojiufengensis]
MFQRSTLLTSRLFSRNIQKQNIQLFKRFKSIKSTPTPIQPKVKLQSNTLLILGALVVGTTIAAAIYNKNEPKSAIEPELPQIQDGPDFPPGKISVVFVLGGPGSGKGTQCDILVREKGFTHLSAGDLLRAEQKRPNSKYGELIAKCIKEGSIVPQEVTVELLKNAIKSNYNKGQVKFLIDGFPRKMDQALTFENRIAKSALTIFFECPEKIMLERLLNRGKTSGRADDNIESIKKRFKTFIDTSMPVVDYFEKQGKVVKVRCDHPIPVVASQVLDALTQRGV